MSYNRLFCNALFGLVLSLPVTSVAEQSPEDVFEQLEDEIKWLQEEVYVTTATKTRETLKKSGSTISVITAEDLKAMGARTLYDALKRLPGFGVSQFNMGMSSIEVRGVKTDFAEKVLFLINGHPINTNLANGGANSAFNEFIVDDIRHVEVVRGPGSALYGTNAFMAVINIITKQAEDVSGAEFTAGVGSDDTKKVNVQFGHQADNLSVAGNFHVSDTNGFDEYVRSDSIGQADHVDYWQTRYEGSVNFQVGDFSGQARYLQRESGSYLGANNVLSNESDQEYIDYFFELAYSKALSTLLSVNVKTYFDHFEFDNTWELLPEGFNGNPDSFFVRSPVKHDVTGIDMQVDLQLTDRHKVLLGAMHEHQSQYDVAFWSNNGSGALVDVSETMNWNDSHNRDISAVYLQDIWDAHDSLRFILGVRYDHYSDFGDTVNPRASATWSVNDDLRVIASYGSAFRAPTFGELYNINNPSVVGNPDLSPEEITTYEIGIRGEFTRKSTYGITYFENKVKDLIAPEPSATAVNTSGNVGELKVKGVELEVSQRFSDGSVLSGNYTYQHPTNEITNERLANVPLHRANLSFNYFVSEQVSLYTSALYKGETIRSSEDPRDDVDDYITVDFAVLARDVLVENLEVKASVYNLFDTHYQDPSPRVMLSDYPKNGVNLMLEATYALN
jgi:iron complex outermembrane receptor protein